MPVRRFSGRKLKVAREESLLSQRELAEKAGVNHVTIARLESGAAREPHPRTVRKLSAALGVPAATLFEVPEDDASGKPAA
jgi:transcriptional regulator with XRE-family HTH domain